MKTPQQANKNGLLTETDIQIETIDPEKAKAYLATQTKNRHVTDFHLMSLVRDMKNGRWHFNGDPIRFDKAGKLIDGQHRLNAVILSGKAQKFVVMRDLPNEAFDTIDTGRKRITADYLSMAGHHYPQVVSSAARWYLAFKRFGNFASKEPITNQDKLAAIAELPDIVSYAHGYATQRTLKMSPAMLASVHILLREKVKGPADEYMDGVITGLELKSLDPRYTVRQWIIRRPVSITGKVNRFTVAAGNLLIRGWNAWRSDERLLKVQPMRDLPVIKG
jgi:hypothetical protein